MTGLKFGSGIDKGFEKDLKRIRQNLDGFNSGLTKIGAAVGAAFSVQALTRAGKEVINITAEFQKFEAVLSNTLGSESEAQQALEGIVDFATQTPFQVSELTDSFVKLANQGFKPNFDQMTALGDLAASTGKDFNQLTEALIDAQVGEFERLKEFGVRASKQGDQVAFTFKGVQKQVEFTDEAIRDYVLSLGEAEGVTGAMAKISETTGGQISNLKDNIELTALAIGQRLNPATSDGISLVSDIVSSFREWIELDAAQEIEAEREEVFKLAGALQNSNTTQEERLRAYNELKEINPDIVEGIDAENTNLVTLTDNLKLYNEEAVNRIVLAGITAEEQKILAKQNQVNATRIEEQTDALAAFSRILAENVSPELNRLSEESLEKIQNGIALSREELETFLDVGQEAGGDVLQDLLDTALGASLAWEEYTKNTEQILENSAQELVNLEERKKIIKDLLGIQEQAQEGAGGGTPDPPKPLTDAQKEKRRKALEKQLAVENQMRINDIISRFGLEETLQDQFDQKMLQNRLRYLKELRKITKDELKQAQLDEDILTTQIGLAKLSKKDKEALDTLIDTYQTYSNKRTAIEKEYQEDIDKLRKNGYEDQAKEAEEALERELKALDDSIVSGSLKFGKWMDTVLPDLAKQGIAALQKELNDLEISLAASGLSEKDILIIKEQIKQLNKEIEKTGKVDTWKEVLDVMNDVNEFAENLINNFDGLDESTKNVATGIVDTVSGIIGLATAVKGVATAVGALEKASVILAVIAAAVQVVSAITKASAKAQELRNDALIREFETIQAINVALIEQNRLYQEGNELFSDDQWGTALAGLEAYNQALNAQVGILDNIKQGFLENIPNEAGARAAYEELLENFTSIDEVLSLIQIKTRDRSGFANFFGVGDEFAGLLDLYPEVIKANGDLDREILQLIVDTEELDSVQKANLENIIELLDQAEQSYAQFGDYISGIFGGVGDEIAQAFQTMFETGDDAMTALEGSFSDMIEKFTRDALEFTFLQPYLNELNNTTKELGEQFARGDITSDDLQKGIVGTLGGFYEDLNKIQPEILKAFATADELAAKAGFESAFNAPEEVVDTLEAGKTPEELSRAGRISEAITEETGSLLVGRMGAIMISNERIANFSADALDYAIQNLVTLNAIKKNTDYLPEIAENTRITAEKL
jgi:hypothetical protein